MNDSLFLIVEKAWRAPEDFSQMLASLHKRFGLDPYLGRQRLSGYGLALLARGSGDRLSEIRRALAEQKIASWIVQPSLPRFAPTLIQHLSLAEDAVTFSRGETSVSITPDDTVLAVLADVSGQAARKSAQRLVTRRVYGGEGAVSPIPKQDFYRALLQGKLVLDLYRLDAEGHPLDAVRIVPGRFNPSGLGEKASISGSANIDQLVRLVRGCAGAFTLCTGFGVDQLPGCKLVGADGAAQAPPEAVKALTRYGWLMADLQRARTQLQEDQAPNPLSSLAAAGPLGAVAEAVSQQLTQAQDEPSTEAPPVEDTLLPPPPSAEELGHHPNRWRLVRFGLAAAAVPVVIFSGGQTGLWPLVARYGLNTGVLPGALSAGALWGGFHFLRLKRRMENTPTSKARSLAMGMVEIHGRARRKYALVSPMTQTPCVFYRLRKYSRNSKGQWQQVSESGSGPVPFYLEDDTGRVLVDPRRASVRPRVKREGAPGEMGMLFAGVSHSEPDSKYVEEVIFEGNEIYVLGFARAARAERASLRERTIAALREIKLDKGRLQRYDTDGDGDISEQEWDAARASVEQEVLVQSLAEEKKTAAAQQAVIGRPPQRSLPFVIAETESEAHLTRNYGWLSLASFSVALALAGWGLWQAAALLLPG